MSYLPVAQLVYNGLISDLIGIYYDTILVVNDRLTKIAYFVLYKEVSDVEDLAYAFL